MIAGYQVRREDKAYAASWYVSNMMNVHLKNGITVKTLAKPFLHELTETEIEQDRNDFMVAFKAQREEALSDGNGS